jgi:GNAT superfamily N-acetyltransferase
MISFRRARRADGTGVFSLLWCARDDIPLRPTFNTDDTKRLIERYCTDKVVWLAELDAKLVGAMVLNGDEILYLVVSQSHRREGVARQLLRKTRSPRRWAKVQPTNISVINLLVSEGYCRDHGRLVAGTWVAYSWRSKKAQP